MAEAPFTGLTASVKLGLHAAAETLCYCSGVDLTLEKDIVEVLAFGASTKEKVNSIKDWNVSIDGTAAFASGNTQEDLYNAFINSTLIVIGVYLDDYSYFEGSGYMQSLKISTAPDDKVNITAGVSGSASVVLTLPTALTGVTIAGTAREGVELTATAAPGGSTATYQWMICSTVGGTYTPVAGATTNKYTPVTANVGKYLKVVATGYDAYDSVVTSAATAQIIAA